MKIIELIESIDLGEINSITDLLNVIYDKIEIPVAIFDDAGQLLYIYENAHNCKCFYRKYEKASSYCSLLIPTFTANVIKRITMDKLCDSRVRISTKFVTIGDKVFALALFQFVLDTDEYASNTENLELQAKANGIDIQWRPTVITAKDREYIFSFLIGALENLKVDNYLNNTIE